MTTQMRKLENAHLGFGGAALARTPGPAGDAEARNALRTAIDTGITHFDTAPFYGHGLSEKRLGEGLGQIDRDRFTISTKVGFRLDPGLPNPHDTGKRWGATLPYSATPDFSFEGAKLSLAQSRKRLNLGPIDIAFVHGLGLNPSQCDAAIHGAFPALEEAKEEGQVARIGIAVNDPKTAIYLLARVKPDIVLLAGGLSLANASADETLLTLCAQSGIEVWPAAPFYGDVLASESPSIFVTTLHQSCAKYGIDPLSAALQFPMRFRCTKLVLAGLRTALQVTDATTAITQNIPPEFWGEVIPVIKANTKSLAF